MDLAKMPTQCKEDARGKRKKKKKKKAFSTNEPFIMS
jgi:hypothetical protein